MRALPHLMLGLGFLVALGPGVPAQDVLVLPIRGLAPAGPPAGIELPFTGGIPFPRGRVRDANRLRVVGRTGREVPAQVRVLAVWPDRSVKWALVDLAAPAFQARDLRLIHDPETPRADVPDPLRVRQTAAGIAISGGGVRASLSRTSSGVLDTLEFEIAEPGGTHRTRTVIRKKRPLRLILDALRLEAGGSLPAGTFTALGPANRLQHGATEIRELAVVDPGPIRVTIRIRGHALLPAFGSTLPDAVKKREPAGRLPFTLWFSFHRHLPLITGQTQIVFTGEPDHDFPARWALVLPGVDAPRSSAGATLGITVLEPGVELVTTGESTTARHSDDRLVYGTLPDGGVAVIRHGWESRPAAVTHEAGDTALEFWPARAGLWDLRRYAREWAVGETGARRERAEDMERYARYAARGLARSHDFALCFGHDDRVATGGASAGPAANPGRAATALDLARAHADRALLTASPAWIASTRAVGTLSAEQTTGPLADLDEALRRTLDYYLFNQDLYRWHGKLAYGFWQTRNGNIHRHDRWERDYGRWGWALGDGAGRIPHALMLAWLRTGERRYLTAGEAAARAAYDTSMVHTVQHLENATRTWWTVTGCNHRHNVQPFGGPYIGLRGSSPGGARLLYLTTGDPVIKDGLDLVVEAAERYLTGHPGRLGASGGSDGQAAGANALLFAFESTGEPRYLELARAMLDRTGLIPPARGKRLGYAAAFGLFHAAVDHADLTDDEAFRKRVVETARHGLTDERHRTAYLPLLAAAHRFTGEAVFLEALQQALPAIRARLTGGLPELPPTRWPGHGGARTADPRANLFRDLPAAMAALGARNPGPDSPDAWPKPQAFPTAWPARVPRSWPRPDGHPGPRDRVLPATRLLRHRQSPRAPARIRDLADAVKQGGLPGSVEPFVERVSLRGQDERDGRAAPASARPPRLVFRVTPIRLHGHDGLRVFAAVEHTRQKERLRTWGLRLRLKLGQDPGRIHVAAGGAFRTERWRVDMNDEQIPDWLTSDVKARWPLWRVAGLQLGPAGSYRIWRANRCDTSPLYLDQGFDAPGWIDLTDKGAGHGLTVRLLRPDPDQSAQAVRLDLEHGLVEIQFHDAGAPPLAGRKDGYAGACDLVFHRGWRPWPGDGLTRAEFTKLLRDLDTGENHGLFAYRLRLARTHKARGPWMEKILQSGVDPHELLAGMMWRGALERFSKKIGIRFDANDPYATIQKIIHNYRKR